MFETQIKNNEIFLLNPQKKEWIGWSKWTVIEWNMWKQNSIELINQTKIIGDKLGKLIAIKHF